ncbi:MAG: hypothetical protein K5771_08860 [Oscillospiraceae bacterium]|nr:hypothetical protein [Oscillospiraceae bacterium]
MRLEALEKEAELYSGEGECYIHIEQTRGAPVSIITNGDHNSMAGAIFCLMIQLAEETGHDPLDLFKFFTKTYKKFGKPESIEF